MLIKDIYLGICDYLKDVRHDRILNKARKIGFKVYCKGYEGNTTSAKFKWVEAIEWKEGSILHYIQQRRWSHL